MPISAEVRPVLAAFALLLAACTGSTPSATTVPTRLPTTTSTASYAQRLRSEIEIRNPDELVTLAGSIWVKTDDGRVVQVDPVAGRVVGERTVDRTSDPRHYCQGFGTDGKHLWACAATGAGPSATIDVVRIDPRTRAVVATIPARKIFHQFRMPFVGGRIWVLAGSGDELVGIDVTTNRPEPPIELGAQCTQVTAIGDALVAACRQNDEILRIDIAAGDVSKRARFPDARNLAASADALWVSRSDSLVRMDAETLEPVVVFADLPDLGSSGDVVASGDSAWIRLEDGSLYRIDAATDVIVEKIAARELGGGSLLVTADSLWVTSNDDHLLVRVARS